MRLIKPDPTVLDKITQDFLEYLGKLKALPEKIEFSRSLKPYLKGDNTKATIYFLPDVYLKTMYLVKETSSEVGWHHTVEKLSPTEYLIKDILLFPQVVTGATVTPDAEEYAKWLMTVDDNTFEQLKGHGHSHVRMGVTPSITDEEYRQNMLTNMNGDDFYIFYIANQTNKFHYEIYDFTINAVYENKDIDIKFLTSNRTELETWKKAQEHFISTYTRPENTAIRMIGGYKYDVTEGVWIDAEGNEDINMPSLSNWKG